MLVSWSFPMIRSSQAPRSRTHRVLVVVAVFVSGCMVQQLSPQDSRTARATIRFHSRTIPGPRFSTAPADSAGVLRAALPEPAVFGVAPYTTQTLDSMESIRARAATVWKPDLNMSGLGYSPEPLAGIGFGQAGTFYFGVEQAGEVDAFDPAGIRAARQGLQPFFPLPPLFARGLGGSANMRPSSNLFSLATLNRMLHGDFYLPFRPSAGGLRFDFDDNMRPGPRTSRLGFGSASAMFTSALMPNGMTFSAGALFGVRSTAFSAGGGLGSIASAPEKNTVPSLGMRLSF